MMSQSTTFVVLVAALLIDTLSYCSAENVYCVTPTAILCSSCPHNIHCATLSEYAQEAQLYFTSNTTMVFLPGDHILDTNITVNNVDRLTLHGESSSGNRATVVRSGSIGLSFTNMVEFKINSLVFTSYTKNYAIIPNKHLSFTQVALCLQSTQDAELVNCSFHDNLGTALRVENTNITLAGNTEFTHNYILCGANIAGGGGIIAFSSTLTFTGNTTFLNNTASCSVGSGAIYTLESSVSFKGINNFINNSASGDGGAIFTYNTILSFSGTNNFINNTAKHAGAILTRNTVLNVSGTNSFIKNSAYLSGGAIAIDNTVLTFIRNNTFEGTNNFISNSAGSNFGAIILYNSIINFNGTNNFSKNSAKNCGAIGTINTVLNLSGTNSFIKNSAQHGSGAIIALDTVLTFNGTNSFIKNSAGVVGGAIFANRAAPSFIGINNFISNSAGSNGGAIITEYTVLTFIGTSNFIKNSAGQMGGVIITNNTALTFSGSNNFINNSADYGGAILTYNNTVLNFSGTSNFINNSASFGGAICTTKNSSLTFNGTIHFINNGYYRGGVNYGGGVYTGVNSTVSMLPNTTVYWENNHAHAGGAIYVQDASPLSYCTQLTPYVPKEMCFFQLPGQNLSSGVDVKLVFKNNSAEDAGSVLYGGVIDHCKLTHGLDSYSSGKVFDMIVHNNDSDYNTTSIISTGPIQICPCENNLPNCSKHQVSHTAYPGETFHVSVVAVGQRNGTVSSTVISDIDQSVNPGHLTDSQYLQKTNNTCTKLKYTIFSLSQFVRMRLYAENSPCSSYSGYTLHILVKLNQTCPPGFNISKSTQSCVCEPNLQRYTNSCTIRNGLGQITRASSQQFWVGYDNQSHELILHPQCPFDYCVNDTVVFPLNNTDKQCAYNRSGLLCGKCKQSYSLVLGTTHCKKCTNSQLDLLIPFVLMGVALVFLLLVCKLTVATGTLSGLMFYANIIGVNHAIFLPVESTDASSVFIAWLNLDFRIETCFYNRMDAYSKTWLQFVFPVYIWALVGLIIVVRHFSQRFARLLGNNPVSVLATLILLSYTKILRTLITAHYITYLEYPKFNKMVWLYDANIDYLSSKHTPLFVVAVLIFIFLFLPYTLLLLFGQWLQALSHLRLFSWVNSARLKPFIDSYHAPYKAKHRYWPGLLLMLRFVLLLVFAFNLDEDHSVNLLAILVANGFLLACAWLSGGVYRNWCLDALECSFALNLITLVGATFYVNHSGGNQLVVGYTSVSMAFATFVCIFAFQLANVTGITQYLNRKCQALKITIRNLHTEAEVRSPTGSLPDQLINPEEYEQQFHTPQKDVTGEPTEEANEGQRRLTPVYTYGSIN